jgi:7,8-dihydropterin-6-yl-methyl-4-(beta-D-ribofuranosyl)aminobenzene 5'-phosphate synthase
MHITVVCDNNRYKQSLGTAWGFSAVLAGLGKTILFDTGPNGQLLLDNMEKLAIEPASIDTVVLSHIHADHTGGLVGFLEENPDVTVYLLKSFPRRFKNRIRAHGAEIIEVEQSVRIFENVYLTGRVGRLIKEQALIICTDKGLIIISGCAHPGIVKIVNMAKELLKDRVFFVMGGFHFEWSTTAKIEKVISAFRRLNVQYVAPCHCTGGKAKALFESHFGENYIAIGAGRVITTAELTHIMGI